MKIILLRLLLIFLVVSSVACLQRGNHGDGRIDSSEAKLLMLKIVDDANTAIDLHSFLKKRRRPDNERDYDTAISRLEMNLVKDVGFLNYANEYCGERIEYAEETLQKIIFGMREGYIDGGRQIQSDSYDLDGRKVDMGKIYRSATISASYEVKFRDWFEKFGSR